MNEKDFEFMEENPPEMEDFGLDFSVYENFKNNKIKLKKSIKKINNLVISTEEKINSLFQRVSILIIYFWLSNKYGSFVDSIFPTFIGWLFMNIFIYVLCCFIDVKFFYNIISLGRYNEYLKIRSKIDDKLKIIESQTFEKVESFEKEFIEYYKDWLDNFYYKYFYRKRSGADFFVKALNKFEEKINELLKASDIFLTEKFNIREYQNYISKRKLDNEIQKTSNSEFYNNDENVEESEDFKEVFESEDENEKQTTLQRIISPTKKPKSISPTKKYRTPQKIDHVKLQKIKSEIGDKGENLALQEEKDYLISIGREDLANKVSHVAKEQGDGLGYDILSFFEDGREKYIEVKTTTQSIETQFYISQNELDFMRENINNFQIYRIQLSKETEENFLKIIEAKEILNDGEIKPVNYSVKI